MSYQLTAKTREERGDKSRLNGNIPATVYGAGKDAESLSLNSAEFTKLYKQAGESSLIDLVVNDKNSGKVLVQDIQSDPLKGKIIHVDLRRIDMSKPITATVELRFIGESPAVKSLGGTLVKNTEEVEVKRLPQDLVSFIEVDLAVLTSFDEVIKVKDIKVPDGVVILTPHAEDVIAKATPAMTEEEIKALEEASQPVDLSKIELATKKKEEEGEGEEGAEEKKEEKK